MLRFFRYAAVMLALGCHIPAHAQNYPSRPVRFIVPYTTGGTLDLQARVIAEAIAKIWQVPVVVENKPGANGVIGTAEVARAAPDGYTVGLVSGQHSTLPSLSAHLPFAMTDLKAVAILTKVPMALLARPNLPAGNVAELVAYAKANAGNVTAGTAGPATMNNIWLKSFEQETGTRFLAVPFRGSGPAHIDIMADRVDVMFDAAGAVLRNIQAGRLKVLAVGGTGRSQLLPDVPTLEEQGFPMGKYMFSPSAAVVPAGTPPEVVQKLGQDLLAVLAQPAIRQRLIEAGLEVVGMGPDQADGFIVSEIDRLSKIVRANNIVAE
ncbi:Bug family tripartite tricarboxylate transporter substrate binding protein [Bordetella bronchiseptica]|uniref:Bug family tripartite tricarboxylate transporter substrate binding protein n=1 Tax=Bordetella bronchiseptica TaxID=518 RepID=UPI00028B02F9|nr:tripartite tricarboxylate transporter substrate binding protein [Bordetella bronchiseptica]AWQ03718.1 hypothetical protein B9G73_02840 [Bordetella bronchiseptica]KAK53596.1 tripartite tricarboxylate transporter family receptor [Bordetella bronchiseptica OSU054]KAK65474.1 tripartite tricarboxylate transporter family receptor [Bordetella bronchiseptica MO211]KCV55672.1 tripartite tricarboxylate transporter family receptor [Bordetella bronchiseptica 7E71]KDB76856.1 tripartite tricarboxylate tr